jgi:hypothetical protein
VQRIIIAVRYDKRLYYALNIMTSFECVFLKSDSAGPLTRVRFFTNPAARYDWAHPYKNNINPLGHAHIDSVNCINQSVDLLSVVKKMGGDPE